MFHDCSNFFCLSTREHDKNTTQTFDYFFKILSDPAEGYGHSVNKIMAGDDWKTWRDGFHWTGINNRWCSSLCKCSQAAAVTVTVAIQAAISFLRPSSEQTGGHKDGLTLKTPSAEVYPRSWDRPQPRISPPARRWQHPISCFLSLSYTHIRLLL